jgi:hypothetical protein
MNDATDTTPTPEQLFGAIRAVMAAQTAYVDRDDADAKDTAAYLNRAVQYLAAYGETITTTD